MHQRHRGFNLLETAIVLGVVGMVIGGSWVAYSNYKEQRDVTQMAADILTVCDTSTRVLNRNLHNGVFQNLTSSQVIKLNILPKNWIQNNAAVSPIGLFHTNVYWTSDPLGGVMFNVMNIKLSQCLRLLPMLSMADPNILTSVTVGTGWWTTSATFAPPYRGDMSGFCNNQPDIHMEFLCTPK